MEERFKLNIKAVVVAVMCVALAVCLLSMRQQNRRNAANIGVAINAINQIGAILGHNMQQGKLVQLPAPEPPAEKPAATPAPAPEAKK